MTAATLGIGPNLAIVVPGTPPRGRHAEAVRSAVVLLVAAFAASSAGAAGGPGRLPGVPAFKTCAAAGPFWPTETLAVSGDDRLARVQGGEPVVKLDLAHRKALRSIRIGAPVIAVALGYGSVWALDSNGTLTRISPATGRVVERIDYHRRPRLQRLDRRGLRLGRGRPGRRGRAHLAGDEPGRRARCRRRRAGRHGFRRGVGVGDLPPRHTLFRIDTRTNAPTKLATLPAATRPSGWPSSPGASGSPAAAPT